MDRLIGRRAALGAGLATAGALAVTACNSPGSATSGGSPSSVSSGKKVVDLASIQVGSSASASIGDAPVLVYRAAKDSVVCFSAICTHAGCVVHPDGAKFACPCHGSVFDAKTGKVLQGPAPQPLPRIQVTVTAGEVVTS